VTADEDAWSVEAKRLADLAKTSPTTHGITAVLTSCGRYDLLQRTIHSFLEMNTCPLTRFIVVEDGEPIPSEVTRKFDDSLFSWICTGKRGGQIAAIDYAYGHVKTPYVFHLEDDWEFYVPGFIERSLAILLQEPKCLQVWLRAQDDTNDHPLENEVYQHQSLKWRRLSYNYKNWGTWHGFSFNPGLRRLKDYELTGGYGAIRAFDFHRPQEAESRIGEFYKERDFYAVLLVDQDGKGYVRHLGDGRTVEMTKELLERPRPLGYTP
jgi:Glycosyl transferase family 2